MAAGVLGHCPCVALNYVQLDGRGWGLDLGQPHVVSPPRLALARSLWTS